MKSIIFVLICAVLIFSCEASEEKVNTENSDLTAKAVEKSENTQYQSNNNEIFGIKSGYLKYSSNAGGMEMTREVWFDNFGAVQYEENYMILYGEKTGGCSLIKDGYKYDWSFGQTEGSKLKFYAPKSTDYNNVSQRDIDRYGIKILGNELIAGRECQKISVEKPVKSTVWMWKGIPLKTVSKFGNSDVTMEAVEIKEESITETKFAMPAEINFVEQ